MSSYLTEDDTDDEIQGEVDPVAVQTALEEAAAFKSVGNEAFKVQDYESALKAYTEAINALKRSNCPKDPILFLNRSATYLALKRYIPANYDAAQAASLDPTNWKAHWRQGVALISMTKKSFRCKQAIEAFEKCLSCGTLPADKVAETKQAISKSQQLLADIEANTPMPDMSNCMPS